MATRSNYESDDDSYMSSDSDHGGSDYDDFVVPVHKKNQGCRRPGPNVQKHYQGQADRKGATGRVLPQVTSKKQTVGAGPGQGWSVPANARSSQGTKQASGGTGGMPVVNVVVCGRVDVGKSTLLGHFLSLIGAVDSRACRNAEELAWILDQGEDERTRGITIDPTKASAIIAMNTLSGAQNKGDEPSTATPTTNPSLKAADTDTNNNGASYPGTRTDGYVKYDHVKINFIDTPGHHDLVPNLVRGAIFASVALVIVDISDFMKEDTNGYFEQHLFLLWCLGLRQFVVCINKMDRVQYQDVYADAVKLLKERTSVYGSGLTLVDVPTSGLKGLNLVRRDIAWHSGPCLLEALQIVSRGSLYSQHIIGAKGDGNFCDRAMVSSCNRGYGSGIQDQAGATLCHIFDLWEESKSQLGCSCYLETGVKAPCKLISLPSGCEVTCSQLTLASPAEINDTDKTDTDKITVKMSRMTVCNRATGVGRDFIDCMTLKGQEIGALTGDRLLVDPETLDRIKTGAGALIQVENVNCKVYVSPGSRHKLTLGYTVDVYVGYFRVGAAIVCLREGGDPKKLKRVTSLWPGQEGVLALRLSSPLFVHPLPLDYAWNTKPLKGGDKSPDIEKEMLKKHRFQRPPLLSRILLRYGGDIVAGGVITVNVIS